MPCSADVLFFVSNAVHKILPGCRIAAMIVRREICLLTRYRKPRDGLNTWFAVDAGRPCESDNDTGVTAGIAQRVLLTSDKLA
ncbi:MAG: hypothetical protein ACRYGK_13950 [Janthinobacterium lividum]